MVIIKDIPMKIKHIFPIILIATAGCEIDNYEAPQLTLSGKILDAQTNELVESGGINSGTIIRLYESDGTQPLLFNTKPDGTFANSKVFAGQYSYLAEGPFVLSSENRPSLVINQNTEVEISVVPNVRLNIQLIEQSENSARIKLIFEKVPSDQNLVTIGVIWSEYRNPNVYSFANGSIIQNDVSSQGLISGEVDFLLEGLEPGTTYFVRGSANTSNAGNYYNYSKQLELNTP